MGTHYKDPITFTGDYYFLINQGKKHINALYSGPILSNALLNQVSIIIRISNVSFNQSH